MKVRPVGPTNKPKLMLIGEAPGKDEERRGIPFCGSSGNELNKMLNAAGIARSECLITNVVDTRPPNNNFGIYYSDKSKKRPTRELLDARLKLIKFIQHTQPRVIVPLGEEALRAVTLRSGIKNERGKAIVLRHGWISRDYKPYEPTVLPTYHPAYILRVYSERPIVELDLRKADRYAAQGYSEPRTRFNIDPTLEDVREFFESRHTPVAFDIESIGPCTRTLGFAWSGSDAISIPLIRHGTHYWHSHEEQIILQWLKDYLADPEIEKYLQNGPFDTTHIARELGLHVDGIVLDTMFSHHLLYPEMPKSLDFLTSIHTDFPLYWGDKNAGDTQNAKYNCYDCCVTWLVAGIVIEQLKKRGMYDFYREEIHPAAFGLTRMQNRGVLIDTEKRDKVRVETQERMERDKAALETILGREINPSSPKQVKELVYDEWRLPLQRSRQTKKVTTNDEALRSLARKFERRKPALDLILDYRQARVLLSTFVEAELSTIGRMHTAYNLAGTVTGRISSSKTIEGLGGNLQNIPRGSFRSIFRADPGRTLIKADLRQAEYMVWCWSAKCWELIELYTTDPDFDVHLLNGSIYFKKPQNEITPDERFRSKVITHGTNYKIGDLKISRTNGIPIRDVREARAAYKAARPELQTWWKWIDDQILTTRTLRNPLGRERIFFGRPDDSMLRAAYSHYCQSTVGDIILRAIVDLDDQGHELLLQVHDELVLQCPTEELDRVARQVKAAMEMEIHFDEVDIPLKIPVEIKVGQNWHEMEEYKISA